MNPLSAFHLPGRDGAVRHTSHGAGADAVQLRHPAPSAGEIERLADRLREAGVGLRDSIPLDRVITAVDRVAARFLDTSDPLRREAQAGLPAVTGYSPEMIGAVLDRMPVDWRRPALERTVRRNFPDSGVLDGFSAAVDGALLRAYPPTLVYHHLSGNVPGVGVTSLIRALLVRAPSLARTSADEPLLPALFAQALAEEDAGLGECLAVLTWPSEDTALLRAAAHAAEVVVVYGSDAALAAVREHASPRARLLEYGHRLSVALVTREALGEERTLPEAARAVALFDQQGCVSPHTIFVEAGSGAAVDRFVEGLGRELDALDAEIPPTAPNAAEAAAIRAERETAVFEEAAGEPVRVVSGAGTPGWTIVLDPRPGFRASCLHRTVRVTPVRDVDEVARRLAPAGALLQTIGVAGPPARLREIAGVLGAAGALRLTSIARLPWPSPQWHHDGRPALSGLVRWCEVEE